MKYLNLQLSAQMPTAITGKTALPSNGADLQAGTDETPAHDFLQSYASAAPEVQLPDPAPLAPRHAPEKAEIDEAQEPGDDRAASDTTENAETPTFPDVENDGLPKQASAVLQRSERSQVDPVLGPPVTSPQPSPSQPGATPDLRPLPAGPTTAEKALAGLPKEQPAILQPDALAGRSLGLAQTHVSAAARPSETMIEARELAPMTLQQASFAPGHKRGGAAPPTRASVSQPVQKANNAAQERVQHTATAIPQAIQARTVSDSATPERSPIAAAPSAPLSGDTQTAKQTAVPTDAVVPFDFPQSAAIPKADRVVMRSSKSVVRQSDSAKPAAGSPDLSPSSVPRQTSPVPAPKSNSTPVASPDRPSGLTSPSPGPADQPLPKQTVVLPEPIRHGPAGQITGLPAPTPATRNAAAPNQRAGQPPADKDQQPTAAVLNDPRPSQTHGPVWAREPQQALDHQTAPIARAAPAPLYASQTPIERPAVEKTGVRSTMAPLPEGRDRSQDAARARPRPSDHPIAPTDILRQPEVPVTRPSQRDALGETPLSPGAPTPRPAPVPTPSLSSPPEPERAPTQAQTNHTLQIGAIQGDLAAPERAILPSPLTPDGKAVPAGFAPPSAENVSYVASTPVASPISNAPTREGSDKTTSKQPEKTQTTTERTQFANAPPAAATPFAPFQGQDKALQKEKTTDPVTPQPLTRLAEAALPPETAAPRSIAPGGPATSPHPVHRQLAFAIAQGEGGVTVRLAPEELGQVSMRLHNDDGTMRLAIHAERADTADLIRRNIDPLVDEMTRLGYDRVSVDISGGQRGLAQDRRQPMPQPTQQELADRPDIRPPETPPRRPAPTSGMDLRL